MVKTVMGAEIPVAVFVAPSGAQAASAGALLVMSADIAAMAPGTNIGAAHPVIPGLDPDANSTMSIKAENDVAALARSIASRHNRNVQWAERAVRESVSATATEALALGIIDVTAQNSADLLKKINGMTVHKNNQTFTLQTGDYLEVQLEPTLREKMLSTLADPDIAYILMMLGAAGLYFELAHPGVVLPGAAGAICLLLGLFATQVLPVNTAGLLLLLLSAMLFILELFITSHGILALGGIASLIMGSIFLYDTSVTGIGLSSWVMWPVIVTVGGFFMTIALLAARAQLKKPQAGAEALTGMTGTVRQTVGPRSGMVYVHGELWKAASDSEIPAGEEVEVTGIKGMTLTVKKVD